MLGSDAHLNLSNLRYPTAAPEHSYTTPKGRSRLLNDNDALRAAYDNSQNWLRHYDTVLFTLTFFVVSVGIGYAAIKLQKSAVVIDKIGFSAGEGVEILFPVLLTMLSLCVTRYMDLEVRTAWKRVVRLEQAMGFYEVRPSLNGSILDAAYKDSGGKPTSFFVLSYGAQTLSLAVPIAVALVT